MPTRVAPAERIFDIVLGALLFGVCASGFLLGAQHATSAGVFEGGASMRLLSAHSAFSVIGVYLGALVVAQTRSASPRALPVQASLALVAIGLVLASVVVLRDESGLLDADMRSRWFPGAARALRVAAGLLLIVLAGRLQLRLDDAPSPVTTALFAAGLLSAVAGLPFVSARLSVPRVAFDMALVTAVALLTTPEDRRARPSPLTWTTALALASTLMPLLVPGDGDYARMLDSTALFPRLLLGARAFARIEPTVGRGLPRAAGVLAIFLFVESLFARLFADAMPLGLDVRDTLVAAGIAHLEVFALLAAGLAGWLRDREAMPFRAPLVRSSLFGAGLGMHLTTWAMIVLGWQGHPRRYATHLPVFDRLHVVAIAGGGLVLLSLAFVVAFTRRAPPPPPSLALVFA